MLKLKKIQIKELNKKADFYNRFGWVKIENFFKKNEIKNIQNKINKFLRKSLKRYNGRNINFASNQRTVEDINSFHRMHDFDWIKKLANQKGLKKIIKKFLKSDPELRACEYFAKPKRKGLPAPIHQDNYYWNVANNKGLTMWVALCPSNRKNGGVYYYDGSHKKGLLEHKASFAKGSSQKIKNTKQLNKLKKTTPALKVGDILIHHALVVHGSLKNSSDKSRIGLTFQYKDKKSEYSKSLMKNYEISLKKQIELRK